MRKTIGIALCALAAACSLSTTDKNACQTSSACREAFGFGSVCGANGFCEDAEPIRRCDQSFLNDTNIDGPSPSDTFLIATIVDATLDTHVARGNAVELAVRQANDSGGLQERGVQLIRCTNEVNPKLDGRNQNEASAYIAGHLAQKIGVPAIVGPPSSNAAQAAFSRLEGTGTLLISPSATSPALTDLEPPSSDDSPGLLWRTTPEDSVQATVIANDMVDRSVESVAVIFEQGLYGSRLSTVFEEAFTGRSTLLPYENSTQRDSAAAQAGSGDFDEVLFVSSQTSDVVGFLLFAANFPRYGPKEIFLTDSAGNRDLLANASSASAVFGKIRGTRPATIESTTADAFFASYSAVFTGETARGFSFVTNSYDAAWLVLYGAAWATLRESTIDGVTIAKGIRKLNAGPSINIVPNSWELVQQRFMLGETVNIRGASGPLDYDLETEETKGPIEVWTIAPSGTDFVAEYVVFD